MKLPSPSLFALTLSLLSAPPALAMDQRQADAVCATWTLECPEGTTASGGEAEPDGTLECRAAGKGRPVKEGPAVTCEEGKAQAWGPYKAGKKHGRHVTLRPDGSWTEEDFVDGKLEGRSVEYSAKGQLRKETFFLAGKKHGRARTWAQGRLASEESWDKGKKGKKPAEAPAPEASEDAEQATTPEP